MQVCSNCGQSINYSRDAISAKQKYLEGNTSIVNCDITILYSPIDITALINVNSSLHRSWTCKKCDQRKGCTFQNKEKLDINRIFKIFYLKIIKIPICLNHASPFQGPGNEFRLYERRYRNGYKVTISDVAHGSLFPKI